MRPDDPVSSLSGVGPVFARKLQKLGIRTVEDLLFHAPSRLVDFSHKTEIKKLRINEPVTITGQVVSIQNIYTKTGKQLTIAQISDGEDTVEAIWMRQPFLTRTLPPGTFVSLSGKLGFWGRKKAFIFPQYERFSGEHVNTGRLLPIYPETAGVSSKWLRSTMTKVLQQTNIDDFLSDEHLSDLNLPKLNEAVNKLHLPKSQEEFEEGYRRLAFNELLMLQIEQNLRRIWWRANTKAHSLSTTAEKIAAFKDSLSFKLTPSQEQSIADILSDINRDVPMNRLLEGDVGSGKTVVAAAAVYAAFINNKKAVLLAPTQILAQQHYETLTSMLGRFGVKMTLAVSGETLGNRKDSQLVVGTHALLHRSELVENSALIVIDEQHRWGVKQRAKINDLAKNSNQVPHILTMTATPIPRTIALTIYGDLDLSTLIHLPKGRKRIKTWVVPPAKREAAEAWVEEQVTKDGVQVFVVCPLIEESEVETFQQVKAATNEYERLTARFPKLKIALLHGKLKGKEKTIILKDFRDKKYDILVSTPVIEVGIDIPNATIMIIEAAERFGLAQLHQLRGRVGRGTRESYCLLFTESRSAKVRERLKAVAGSTSGKELSEVDLKLRGPGQILGIRQHGLSELKIARWDDYALIKKTRSFAQKVVERQEEFAVTLSYFRKKQAAPN